MTAKTDASRKLRSALDKYPRLSGRWMAQVIVAHVKDGMQLEEVAGIAGVPPATVRRWMMVGCLTLLFKPEWNASAAEDRITAIKAMCAKLRTKRSAARHTDQTVYVKRLEILVQIEVVKSIIRKDTIVDSIIADFHLAKPTYYRWLARDGAASRPRVIRPPDTIHEGKPNSRMPKGIPTAKPARACMDFIAVCLGTSAIKTNGSGSDSSDPGPGRYLVLFAMDRYSRLIVKWKILQPPKADMALLVDPVQWMRHHRFESYDWLPPRKSSYLVQKLLSIDPVIPWTTIAFCDNMRRGQLVLNLSPMDPLLAYIETAPDPFQLSSRIKRYNNNLFGLSIDRHKRTPMQLYVEGDYRQERESARRQRNADFFDIQKKISAVEARVGYENRRQSRIWQRLMAKSREITA